MVDREELANYKRYTGTYEGIITDHTTGIDHEARVEYFSAAGDWKYRVHGVPGLTSGKLEYHDDSPKLYYYDDHGFRCPVDFRPIDSRRPDPFGEITSWIHGRKDIRYAGHLKRTTKRFPGTYGNADLQGPYLGTVKSRHGEHEPFLANPDYFWFQGSRSGHEFSFLTTSRPEPRFMIAGSCGYYYFYVDAYEGDDEGRIEWLYGECQRLGVKYGTFEARRISEGWF